MFRRKKMSFSDVGSLPRICTTGDQSERGVGNWISLKTYHAKSTTEEKANRIGNNIVFGIALYGAYAYLTGPIGPVSYAAIALTARKILSTMIGYMVYPAAFTSFPCTVGNLCKELGNEKLLSLQDQGFFFKKISVYKSGTKYDAAIIGHMSTINNGKWTFQALGNGMMMEPFYESLAKANFNNNSNTLLINGPSVCESGGWPTRYQMGAGFEAGLQLLENEIKATHIVMRGLSLGGGMMAEAILNHDFTEGTKNGIKYLSISDRTFSRLSTIVGDLEGSMVKYILQVTNTELDGIEAARKLSQLGIRHIIIQHCSNNARGSDNCIHDSVSLAHELHQEEGLRFKVYLESDEVKHSAHIPLPKNIENSLKQEVNEFFLN
jgi:hypothetical protein